MKLTKVIAVLIALFMLPLAAATAAETCPEEGKVEANGGNQDAINDLVLEEGTQVCIKGGQTLVNVTADGVSTLQELLGTGQDVSHYTITSPAPTTTTTTSIPTTSTTSAEETTTTNGEESTTSTNPQEETSSTSDGTEGTEGSEEEETEKDGETLPFTGMDNPLALIGLALALVASGGLIIRRQHS